jgi:hypothetical protein
MKIFFKKKREREKKLTRGKRKNGGRGKLKKQKPPDKTKIIKKSFIRHAINGGKRNKTATKKAKWNRK